MNYPVWYIPSIGGGIIIAFVAIVHVVVSHFAVGGGLWLVLTEKKAYREKKDFILEYVKKHTLFFMLLTMVFGSMTGVGIWITISLISPDGTSQLIHSFVFGWAIEWVFFVIEIVTAFLYFYTFKKISQKMHLLIGWIYFLAAWASLFVINAILSFMMTPGDWLKTQSFWDGVFNPTFLSSSIFRTFLCLALAGSYALLTATKKFYGEERQTLVKYNGKWIMYSLAGMIPSLIWYYSSIPELAKKGMGGSSNIMKISFYHLIISLVIFLLLLLLMILYKSKKLSFSLSITILLSIFVFFGAFEFIREAGRKPYIIGNYMIASGIRVSDFQELKDQSILEKSKWVQTRTINDQNELQAGEEIFRIECSACHTLGFKNNILPVIKQWSEKKLVNILGRLKGITPFMPDFIGNEREKKALAKWLYTVSHRGVKPEKTEAAVKSVKGETVFENQCSVCHDITDPEEFRLKLKKYKSFKEISDLLGRLDEISEDMPPFEGTESEKKALAEYLNQLKNRGKEDE